MKNKLLALKKYAGIESVVISPIPYTPKFLTKNSTKRREYYQTERKGTLEGISVFYPRYIRLPGTGFRKFEGISIFFSILPLFLKLKKTHSFDLLLGGNLTEDGFASYFLGKLFKIKAASFAIGSDVNTYPFESKTVLHLTRFLLRNLDSVICVGAGLKKQVESRLGSFRSLSVNYLGVALDQFEYIPRVEAPSLRGLFVGAIEETKGIFDLLEAVQKIDSQHPFTIDVIGGGAEESQNKLIDYATKDPRIQYHGRVGHEELVSFFKKSDFFIFPTHTEGCATVLTEASACGLPLLTTSIPQNFDFLGEGTLMFEKKNIDQIKETLIQFFNLDQKTRLKMANHSRALASRFEEKKAALDFKKIMNP